MTLTAEEVKKIVDTQEGLTAEPSLDKHPEFLELLEQYYKEASLRRLSARATATLCADMQLYRDDPKCLKMARLIATHELQAVVFGLYVGLMIGEDRARIMSQLLK